MSPTTGFDPDALASLESERDFLLRSIRDLDAEREAGNLDDERYTALKDDYTARAAAVLRSIEAGRDARPAAAAVNQRRKLVTGAAIVAFVVVAALALAAAAGRRHPGETITGNAQSAANRRAALEQQVKEHPDDPAAHLVFGRYLLESQEWSEAVKQYLVAAKLDPKNPEANAYAGWMLFQVAQSPNGDPKTVTELTDGALARLDAAVAASETYPDAHFFRGMVQFRGRNNAKAAVGDFERYLALVPNGPLNDQVKSLLDQARRAAG
jgi:cytochrome c-type biogenesis protein CcmH/NrfG